MTKAILTFLIKQWPLLAVLLAGATSMGWFNAYKNNQVLRADNRVLQSAYKAADEALAKHREADLRLAQLTAERVKELAQIPNDGCLDTALPSDYVRLRAP